MKRYSGSIRQNLVLLGLFPVLHASVPEVLPLPVTDISQQSRQITGVVVDDFGDPVIGANVVEKGTLNGTMTDLDGKFSLTVPNNATLQITYIGFISQEIAVNGQSVFNIQLREDTQTLEEVVVVGYGTMRKKDLTGSIVQIRPDNLVNESPKTVQDLLRGTPGVQIGYDASAKGGGSMKIRGQRSVYTDGGHNDPLIILDGMMFYGELSEINPDDIGQIDILKDASSAAIYGAKAANGVIIITTKKGKLGKPVINVSTNVGLTTKSSYREVYSPDGYMQYREDWYKSPTYGMNETTGIYEAYQNSYADRPGYFDRPGNIGNYGVSLDAWRGYTTNESGESDLSIYAKRLNLSGLVLENYLAGRTFDWYKHTFRTGFNQDYNASVSGASERMNYYMSFGYMRNEGAVQGNEYKTMRANLKLDGKVTDWLEVSTNINFQDRTDGDIQPELGTDYWDNNQLRNSPYASYRDEDGNLVVHPMGSSASNKGVNYDFEKQYLELEKGYQVLNTMFSVKVKLPYNINYSFNIAPRFQYFYDRYFVSSEHPDRTSTDSQVNREQAKRFDWSLNNTISWQQTFANKHNVNLTLVQEAEERRYWQDRIEARNILPSDALGFHNTTNATSADSKFSSTDTHETANALLARLFYSYDDRYMVTASVRRDGYSAFGSSNPYATFPSVALAWSFADEKFFDWYPLSTGKLRASWGKNGNRSLNDPYISLANLGAGTGKTMGYVDASGNTIQMKYLSVDRMANPHLQWEKTTAYNIGLDFGFLGDRIAGNIEYYIMNTHDMIMSQRLPGFSGFSSIATNLGEVQNRGIEIALNTVNIQNKNFEWTTSIGFSYNKNQVKHLYYENENVYDTAGNIIGTKEMDDTSNGWFIGQPIGVIWDYNVTGIWQVDEIEEAARHGQRPGDPKVANNYTADDEVNEDGTIKPVYNDKDKEFLGQTNPPYHWSIRNEFTFWKNLSFSFNIYSYMGHKSLSGNYLNQDNGGSMITYGLNTFKKEYWTPENPSNKYGRLDAQGPSGLSTPRRIHNRNFIRLDNIAIAYTIPRSITSKWNVERVKVHGTIRNVAVWKKDWEYGDPETGDLGTRIFTLGLNLTF
ncbi:MAG: SusC/RagA family TonB-linked outer membrane protein [Tannerellaceae bacterium]|nr:SusC/RagA family TonB-linked outer membrane protein [Tannerellaceae bacterium]